MNEVSDLAGQHELVAEDLQANVIKELTALVKDLKEERKVSFITIIQLYNVNEQTERFGLGFGLGFGLILKPLQCHKMRYLNHFIRIKSFINMTSFYRLQQILMLLIEFLANYMK